MMKSCNESQMKKVTRNNLLKFIEMKMKYQEQDEEEKDEVLLEQINQFINEVINKDKHYYKKVYSYNFTDEELKFLLWKEDEKWPNTMN